ncbi:MAG: family 16 glycosylhydrolase [Cyclobacteriaceae bacterium]
MNKLKVNTAATLILIAISFNLTAQDYPLSDPDNTGNWILNGDFSDEFEGDSLNRSRWHLQGEYIAGCEGDGCRDGIYYNGFKGRWPAQFTPNNAKVDGGKLILETKWEPEFTFLSNCDEGNTGYCYGKDLDGNPLPVTTAGVNSLKQFTYGYMEIYSKAANAEITSSFWTIGSGAEIDMFEMFGKYEAANRKHKEKELKFNLIEWGNGFKPRFETFISTDWRVADDYHTYGFEWDDTSVSVYVDGEFQGKYTGADFTKNLDEGRDWTFTGSQRLWVDQECFPWNGLPNEEDLPAQYQIEYIRVWQKADQIEDTTAPTFADLDHTLALNDGLVSVTVSEQSRIFLVPEGIERDKTKIEAANAKSFISNEGRASVPTNGSTPGNYILYAIDWAGNISDASESFTIESAPPVLGISPVLNNLDIFPNPAADFTQISGLKERHDSVRVINTLGQSFKVAVLNNQSIDLRQLTTGMYVIQIPGYSPVRLLKK